MKVNMQNNASSFVDSDGIEVNAKKLFGAFDKSTEWSNKGMRWVKTALVEAPHVIEAAALMAVKAGWDEHKSQDPNLRSIRNAVKNYTDGAYTLVIGKEGKGEAAKPVSVKFALKGKPKGANANKAKTAKKAEAKGQPKGDSKAHTLFNEWVKHCTTETADRLIERIQEVTANMEATRKEAA